VHPALELDERALRRRAREHARRLGRQQREPQRVGAERRAETGIRRDAIALDRDRPVRRHASRADAVREQLGAVGQTAERRVDLDGGLQRVRAVEPVDERSLGAEVTERVIHRDAPAAELACHRAREICGDVRAGIACVVQRDRDAVALAVELQARRATEALDVDRPSLVAADEKGDAALRGLDVELRSDRRADRAHERRHAERGDAADAHHPAAREADARGRLGLRGLTAQEREIE